MKKELLSNLRISTARWKLLSGRTNCPSGAGNWPRTKLPSLARNRVYSSYF